MKTNFARATLVGAVLLALAACGSDTTTPVAAGASQDGDDSSQPIATTAPVASAVATTAPAPTPLPLPTETASPLPTPTSAPAATATTAPVPSPTAAPTATAAPTPSPVEQVEDSSDDLVVPAPGQPWKRLQSRDDLSNEQPVQPEAVVPGGGNTLLVRFWGGAEPCFGARVQVVETDQLVEVRLVSGLPPGAASTVCIAIAVPYEIEVVLASALGDRETVINQTARPNPVPEVPDDAVFATDQYLGLTLAEAEQLAAVEQRVLRTARIDDEYFGLTLDFEPSRVNVEIEGGVVVAANAG